MVSVLDFRFGLLICHCLYFELLPMWDLFSAFFFFARPSSLVHNYNIYNIARVLSALILSVLYESTKDANDAILCACLLH